MLSVSMPAMAWKEPHMVENDCDNTAARLVEQLNQDLKQRSYVSEAASVNASSQNEAADPASSPGIKSKKLYQATVEDDLSEEQPTLHHEDSPATSPPPSPRSSMRDPSRPKTPTPRVHFSKRPPPKICTTTSSPVSSEAGGPPYKQNSSKPRVREGGEVRTVPDARWGYLFDEAWRPTERFRDVYCGIATYLITPSEPRDSLVLSPRKLRDFYTQFGFGNSEIIPIAEILEGAEEDIDIIYDRLSCEYFLVPAKPGQPPSLPALTRNGFARWMELFARACPSAECARLSRIADKCSISAASSPEKLPKHVSRHMFPPKPDDSALDRILSAYQSIRRRGARKSWVIHESTRREMSPPRERVLSSSYPPSRRSSCAFDKRTVPSDSSRRYPPRQRDAESVDRPRISSRGASEEYTSRPRRDRSPSPPRRSRPRPRDSSPPPPRRRRRSSSVSTRPSDVLSSIFLSSSSRDGRSREYPKQRYYAGSQSSRRDSMESVPRSPVDGRSPTSRRGFTHEEWVRDR